MSRLVAAELLKLRTVRTSWGLAVAALALVTAGTTLTLATTAPRTESDVRSLLSFAGSGAVVVVILAIVGAAGDYRHRTIVPTLLVSPRRARTVGAQGIAYALIGLLIGVAGASLTAAIALAWLAGEGLALHLSTVAVLGVFAGGILYTSLASLLGFGLGVLVRNQVGAAVAMLVWFVAVEPIISATVPGLGKFGLTAIGITLSGGTAGGGGGGGDNGPYAELLPFWPALLVYVTYAAGLVLAATWASIRREIV